MKARTVLLGLLVLVAAASTTLGAMPDAAPLSLQAKVLYAHHDEADTAELDGWMNTEAADGDDTAMGPAGSCAPHSGNRIVDEEILLGLVGDEFDRTYNFTLDPIQKAFMTLREGGNISATIHAGAGSCFGLVDFESTLYAGDEVIAQGRSEGHWYDNTAGVYPHTNLTMELNETFAPTHELRWEIHVTGETGGLLFLGISEEKGSTRLDLPVVDVSEKAPGGGPVALPPGKVDLSFSFSTPTNESHEYNWTAAEAADQQLVVDATLDSGNVTVTLSRENETLFNETLTASESQVYNFTAEPETSYDLGVVFSDAVGNTSVAIVPAEDSGTETPPSESGTTGPPDTGTAPPVTGSNDTSNGTGLDGDGDEELMPVPFWVPLLALGALIAWRRRK